MRERASQRGFILVAVLTVILLASMVAVSLMFRLRAEELAAAAGATTDRGWDAAISGVYAAMDVAARSRPDSLDWQNQPDQFLQKVVWEDGAEIWCFTVFSAPPTDIGATEGAPVRFGLTDEASKININATHQPILEKLPRVTPPLAQAIRDFCDADVASRPQGAEQEFYSALDASYPVRNGPLASLDQLLQVRGVTRTVLYGEDANGNFRLDRNEDDGDDEFPPDDGDGQLNRGLRQYLTVGSYEPNVDATGFPRRELNDPAETFFDVALPGAVVEFIDTLRRNKIRIEHPADLLEAKGKFKDKDGKEKEMESGVTPKELPLLLDAFTTTNSSRFPGLVNLNTAPVVVLQSLPGMDLTLAESVAAARKHLTPERRQSIAWLYEDGVVDAGLFKQLARQLTARSFQFHFHVIGFSLPSARYRVLEVEIDLGTGRPIITYLRDVTRGGLPFPLAAPTNNTHG